MKAKGLDLAPGAFGENLLVGGLELAALDLLRRGQRYAIDKGNPAFVPTRVFAAAAIGRRTNGYPGIGGNRRVPGKVHG